MNNEDNKTIVSDTNHVNSESTSKKTLLKHGTSLSFLTFISRILGLLREMTKSAFMGTSAIADAFAIAFLIPNLLRRLFAENSITVAFIPTFKKYLDESKNRKDNDTKKELKEFLSSIFTLLTFLTTTVVLIGIIITPIILKLAFPHLGETFSLTVLLTRIMFPYLICISIAAFFQGILNGVKIFSPSGITPILFNIIVIGCTYILTDYFNNASIAMAIGVALGGIVQALFQLPFVLTKFRFSIINLKKVVTNEGTKKVVALFIPTFFGMAAYQLNDLICSSLAKYAGTGVLSSLQYSMRLQEVLLGVFAVSVGTVILPDLSSYASKKDWQQFQNILETAIKTIALITIPATFFSLFTGEHIITLIYKTRNFTNESVHLTLSAFTFHIAVLFFIALNRILAPAFYAQGNSKYPALAGIVSVFVNTATAIILVNTMSGPAGLALSLAISSIANTVLLFVFLNKNQVLHISTIIKKTVFAILKMSVFSIIACSPLFLYSTALYQFFEGHNRIISEGIPLFIQFIIFSTIGIALLIITKDTLIRSILKKVKR